MGTNRYALLFKPGTYGTADAAAADQGRLLHRGRRPRRLARPTSTINGKIEVYNRCLADGGTSNCLALVNFWRTLSNLTHQRQRRRARTAAARRRTSGPSRRPSSMRRVERHRRQPVADGLLHRRPAVRQRRLHRRLALPARRQRLAAAVADPQQRDRRAGPTASGTRSSPASRARPDDATFPTPPYTTLDDDAGQPGEAVPVRRRARARTRSACPSAQTRHARHHLGRRHDRRAARSRCRDFFVATAVRLGAGDQQRSSPAASTCC